MYMKRKNKLLVGCLALLLALSVGYALFSETITINGTATAKGSFDIETTCTGGVSDELWPYLISSAEMEGAASFFDFYKDKGFSNDSCQVVGNEVKFSVDLEYPTAVRYFVIKTTNKGTITAGIDDSSAFYAGSTSSQTCIYNKSDDSLVSCTGSSIAGSGVLSGEALFIAAEDKNGNLYGWDNSEIEEKYMDSDMIWTLKENESFYFVYFVLWDSSWSDKTKYMTYTATGELPFVQYNN